MPIPSGEIEEIEHLGAYVAKKTLGVYVCPTGSARMKFKHMLEAAARWIDQAKEGKLQRRDIWFLPDHQL